MKSTTRRRSAGLRAQKSNSVEGQHHRYSRNSLQQQRAVFQVIHPPQRRVRRNGNQVIADNALREDEGCDAAPRSEDRPARNCKEQRFQDGELPNRHQPAVSNYPIAKYLIDFILNGHATHSKRGVSAAHINRKQEECRRENIEWFSCSTSVSPKEVFGGTDVNS